MPSTASLRVADAQAGRQRLPELRSSPAMNRVPSVANAAYGFGWPLAVEQKGRRRDAGGPSGEKLFEIPNGHPLPPDAREASRRRAAL